MKKFVLGLMIALGFVMPVFAVAQNVSGGSTFPTVSNNNNPPSSVNSAGQYSVPNPLKVGSVCGLIKALLQAALDIGIPIAVLFIVYAGFKFVWARGNPEALSEARQNLLYVIIGIGIFLGAWLLAQIIANTVNAVAGGSNALVSCK